MRSFSIIARLALFVFALGQSAIASESVGLSVPITSIYSQGSTQDMGRECDQATSCSEQAQHSYAHCAILLLGHLDANDRPDILVVLNRQNLTGKHFPNDISKPPRL
jgi:hypothetical protein